MRRDRITEDDLHTAIERAYARGVARMVRRIRERARLAAQIGEVTR